MSNEIPKGLRLVLQMVGITPEMLQNPAALLQQFGVNPAELTNKVAEFQQIGLRIEAAFIRCEARLARIENTLGIDAPLSGGVDDGAGANLGNLGLRPPNKRN